MSEIDNIEPFLYDAAPINATPDAAAETYYSIREALGSRTALQASVPPPQAAASAIQINEHAVEGYMNRILEAMQADLAALDVRITALEP